MSSSRRASSVISAKGLRDARRSTRLWGVKPPQFPMIGERLARYFEIPGIAMLVLHHEFRDGRARPSGPAFGLALTPTGRVRLALVPRSHRFRVECDRGAGYVAPCAARPSR